MNKDFFDQELPDDPAVLAKKLVETQEQLFNALRGMRKREKDLKEERFLKQRQIGGIRQLIKIALDAAGKYEDRLGDETGKREMEKVRSLLNSILVEVEVIGGIRAP